MNKALNIVTKLVIIDFIIVCVLLVLFEPKSRATPKQPIQNTVKVVQSDLTKQVASHASTADCWMVIQGKVYNITSYFGTHPGGDELLQKYCGKDGTAAFNTKDEAEAEPHSAAATKILERYLVQ